MRLGGSGCIYERVGIFFTQCGCEGHVTCFFLCLQMLCRCFISLIFMPICVIHSIAVAVVVKHTDKLTKQLKKINSREFF